jgi:beta-mannanase
MTNAARTPFHIALFTLLLFGLLLFSGMPREAQAAVPAEFKVGVGLEYASGLANYESITGRKADVFLWYQSISEDLDVATLGPIAAGGRTVQLAWEPWDYGASDLVNQPAYQLRDITNGNWDTDIRRWARQMRDFGYPIMIRPMCEMNGDWTSWSGIVNGNAPADYAPAFRHVHDIFVQEGATNVKFVWSPNRDGDSSTAAWTFTTYYPGDNYVDYIGIDGYNWGTMYKTADWTSSWEPFDEVLKYSYDAFTSRSVRPVFISEMATTELGGDKAAWITDTFNKLPVRFPRIVGLTWFNYNKETDWRVNSSTTSLTAYKNAVVISGGTAPAPAPVPVPVPAGDTTVPTVSFATPLNGAVLSGRVKFKANASDNVGITKVELYIGDRLLSTDTLAPYVKWVRTKQFPNGTYTVTAKAYDAAGNVGVKQILVTIRN